MEPPVHAMSIDVEGFHDGGLPTAPGPARWFLRVGRERLAPRLAALPGTRRFVPIRGALPQVTAASPADPCSAGR